MAINAKALKGKKFNLGNKTAALANKLGEGQKVTMTIYDVVEVTPEYVFGTNTPYEGDPLLYFNCEWEGKQGYRIKCNSEECVKFIVDNNRTDLDIEVEVVTYTDSRSGKERKRFDLASWS